jgi:ABC-type multidrug transport system ATPase subunit
VSAATTNQVDVGAPFVAEGFGRRYRPGKPWAARNISFELAPGSITALVGPNGAGKSTLIRAGVGFERPDEGRVLAGGHDPAREPSKALKFVGYVPQAASLYASATIADHLALAAEARGWVDAPYVMERLQSLALEPDRTIGSLSGGEQAQVALTICLGVRAKLLLLDEPLASLDPLARRRFLNMLVAYVRETRATALLSSHIVTDIEQACDYLFLLVADTLLSFTIALAVGSVIGRVLPALILATGLTAGFVFLASQANDLWLRSIPPVVVGEGSGPDAQDLSPGAVVTGLMWRALDGGLLSQLDGASLAHAAGVPLPGLGDEADSAALEWLEANGYVPVTLGVPRATALSWAAWDDRQAHRGRRVCGVSGVRRSPTQAFIAKATAWRQTACL